MTKLGMVIDTQRCIGCHTCSIACKMQNNVPQNMLWNRIVVDGADVPDGSEGTYPNLTKTFTPVACQHCENPACEKVCPTGATYKDDRGRVEIDYDKCIGCRMCMAACPYNARVYNWNDPVRDPGFDTGDKEVPARMKGVMEKCTLCKERTDRDEDPFCVKACMAHARVFGDLDDPSSEASRLVASGRTEQLLAHKGTSPQVHYIR